MAYSAIDIGNGAASPSDFVGAGQTCLDKTNTANATGVLTSVEIWTAYTGTFVYATFSGATWTFTSRDSESLGSCASGAKRTKTGLNIDVSSGDVGGTYSADGQMGGTWSGGSGVGYTAGNKIGAGSTLYSGVGSGVLQLYATGVTVPDAPTSVSATDNLTDKVTITWTAGTGETAGHKVYRDGSVLNSDTAISHGTNTFDDTTGTAGTTYAYTVKAINAAGLSAASTADNGIKIASSSFIQQIMKTKYTSPFGGII